jgi:hypothetical protein
MLRALLVHKTFTLAMLQCLSFTLWLFTEDLKLKVKQKEHNIRTDKFLLFLKGTINHQVMIRQWFIKAPELLCFNLSFLRGKRGFVSLGVRIGRHLRQVK